MLLYKSFCRSPKTFYGVTFNYGESKAVPGYIHDRRFVCLDTNYTSPAPQLKVKQAEASVEVALKPASAQSKSAASTGKDDKQSEPKKEEKKSESKKSEPKKAEKVAAKNSDSKSKVDEKSNSDKAIEPKKEDKKS